MSISNTDGPIEGPEDDHRQLPELKDRLHAALERSLRTGDIFPPGLRVGRWLSPRSPSLVRPHVLPVHPRDAYTDVRIARAEAKRARRRERNLRNAARRICSPRTRARLTKERPDV